MIEPARRGQSGERAELWVLLVVALAIATFFLGWNLGTPIGSTGSVASQSSSSELPALQQTLVSAQLLALTPTITPTPTETSTPRPTEIPQTTPTERLRYCNVADPGEECLLIGVVLTEAPTPTMPTCEIAEQTPWPETRPCLNTRGVATGNREETE